MPTALPLVIPEKGRLTEQEARLIGNSATRIAQFRGLYLAAATGGTFTAKTGGGVTAVITLAASDAQACMATLIEREAAFLAGFNIELEQPNP